MCFRGQVLLITLSMTLAVGNRAASGVDFVHKVMPILKQHCAECHTGQRKEGGLSMNSRAQLLAGGENGEAVVVGESDKSEILQRILAEDETLRMPPEGPRVATEQVAILKQWIDAGLPWEEGITLGKSAWEPPLRPREVELPPSRNGRLHPIDRLLDAYLAEKKIETPPPISDAAFFRRASLDAIGLLPAPAAMGAFVKDSSADKREKLIDELMADDVAYADHWLTMWNDLLRNDYTGTGFITGGRKQITTWLYASLRHNKPYDQMVRELIAPTRESSGFIDGIKWRGETNASQTREIQFAQNISQVFLGINMKCASCHDSFIDRWKLADAYGLAAIYADQPLEIHRCDKPTGEMASAKWIFPELGRVDPDAAKAQRLEQLAALMTHPENGRFTRTVANRIWHRLMGRGIVHPVDAMHTQPFSEDLLDYLAARFAADGYDLRKFIAFVMKSQAYQSQTVILQAEPGEEYAYAGPLSKRMTAEQFLDCVWQFTGTNPNSATPKVNRTTNLAASGETPVDVSPISAKWIWHPEGGVSKTLLTRRVELDAAPDHAPILVTCDNAFVMRINGVRAASSKDWQKPLLLNVAKFFKQGENVIEVDAEMFGGACGFICQIDFGANESLVTDNAWKARKPDGKWIVAREIHAHGDGPWGAILNSRAKARSSDMQSPPVRAALVQNDFLMRSLGRPHRDQVVTTRPGELTTLQAIDLANGEILAGYLRRGAGHLLAQHDDNEDLIDWLFRYALSRKPTDAERTLLLNMLGEGRDPQAVQDALWAIFMLPEFQTIQ